MSAESDEILNRLEDEGVMLRRGGIWSGAGRSQVVVRLEERDLLVCDRTRSTGMRASIRALNEIKHPEAK